MKRQPVRLSERLLSARKLFTITLMLALSFAAGYITAHRMTTMTALTARPATQQPTTAVSTAPPPSPSQGSGNYLVINEWGVRLKPAISLPAMSYWIDTSEGHEWAKLIFDDMPPMCAGFWHLDRAKPGADLDGYGNTPEELIAGGTRGITQVDGYYYMLAHGQLGCGLETEKQNKLITQIRGDGDDYVVEAIPDKR